MMSSREQTGNPSTVDPPPERILESLDAIGREHEIQIERTVLQLNEVLAANNLLCVVAGQREPEFSEVSTRYSPHHHTYGGGVRNEQWGPVAVLNLWSIVARSHCRVSATATYHASYAVTFSRSSQIRAAKGA